MRRRLLFVFVLLVGAGLGLLYGWVINPIEYKNARLDQINDEFQTDYVLMIAETYQLDGNLVLAARRLADLNPAAPDIVVRQALVNAARLGYAEGDLNTMTVLLHAFESILPASGAGTP